MAHTTVRWHIPQWDDTHQSEMTPNSEIALTAVSWHSIQWNGTHRSVMAIPQWDGTHHIQMALTAVRWHSPKLEDTTVKWHSPLWDSTNPSEMALPKVRWRSPQWEPPVSQQTNLCQTVIELVYYVTIRECRIICRLPLECFKGLIVHVASGLQTLTWLICNQLFN